MPRVKQAPVKGWPYSPRHHLLVRREIRINALLTDDPDETVSSHQYCLT